MNPDRWHESIPVPAGLENRIRATVARRRFTLAAAAAVLLGAAALLIHTPPRPPDTPIAFAVSLATPAPEPMRLQEVSFTAEVDAARDVLILHFGGPAHD